MLKTLKCFTMLFPILIHVVQTTNEKYTITNHTKNHTNVSAQDVDKESAS